MRRLLLVTHRSIEQPGGPAARWRAFTRYLPEHGWEVEVLSAIEHAGTSEFDARSSRAVARRAAVTARLARLCEPMFDLAGVRPDALPLSMLWIPRGALLLRRRIKRRAPDVVLATGPPFAGLIAAGAGVGDRVPLVMELRDLWAGNPAFDAGGRLLSAIERRLLGKAHAVVACTPEAVSDLRLRHPELDGRVVEISNGFDPEIRSIAMPQTVDNTDRMNADADKNADASTDANGAALTLLHSGTLTAVRPIAPLVRALESPDLAGSFRLVLHGYLSPASQAEVERATRESSVPIEVLPPCSWSEAVARIAKADAGLITQASGAGDETAIASKIYEYLALRKPVLCLTDGGASEALLRRLDADQLCARLDAPETIVVALTRLRDRAAIVPPSPERLEPYSRQVLAGRMAALLEDVARGERGGRP
jgi:hypothetical protein